MFDSEFYPTPEIVIQKMLRPYFTKQEEWYGFSRSDVNRIPEGMTILEPSAGSGAILDFLKDNGRDLELYACESDPNLKEMLRGKGYRLIADDFFEFKGGIYFDLIVMNPPFSNGHKHLLHAWSLMDEGNIVCLLNEETVKNPYSEERKHLLSLIEQFGSIEYLGDCFSNAARKTDVNVAMVRLKKVASAESKFKFNFDKVTSEKGVLIDQETFKSEVAVKDIIGNMMIQFEHLQGFFLEFMKVRQGLNFYSQGITSTYFEILKEADSAISSSTSNRGAYNKFSAKVRAQMWKIVIEKSDVQRYMTSDVRKNFESFINSQSHMDFTKENVFKLIDFIFMNRNTILEQAIVDVFNEFTSHHAENRYMVEGWKTNGKYKVNRKVILPRVITYGEYYNAHDLKMYGDRMTVSYHGASVYDDIDKVMCFLTGRNYEQIQCIRKTLDWKLNAIGKVKTGDKFDNVVLSTFFEIKFFKKGTIHLYFRDEKLWEEFNMRACYQKNWLPAEEAHEYEARKRKENSKKQSKEVEPEPLLLELF